MVRKYLLFTAAGDNTRLESQWFDKTTQRDYDVWVAYYGNTPARVKAYKAVAERVFDNCKGGKFEIFQQIYDQHKALLGAYEYVAVFDDDLLIRPPALNRLFGLCAQYKLKLAQPAFAARGSKISWPITRVQPKCLLRYVNFVEYNAMVFSRDSLRTVMDTGLPGKLQLKLDWLIPQLLKVPVHQPNTNVAIMDAVTCVNPYNGHKPQQRREINTLVVNRPAERAKWTQMAKQRGFKQKWPIRSFGRILKR